jgi:hypothetical protein
LGYENWCSYKYSSSKNDTVHRISCIMPSLIKMVERRKSNDSDISSTTGEGLKLEIYTQTLANNIYTEFLKIMICIVKLTLLGTMFLENMKLQY